MGKATLSNYYTKSQVYTKAEVDAKISSSSSSASADPIRYVSGIKVDTGGLVHLTGKEIYMQYAAGVEYPYLIWSGSYNASNLPTTYGTFTNSWSSKNQQTGLMGRFLGKYSRSTSSTTTVGVQYKNATTNSYIAHTNTDGSGGNNPFSSIYDSTFTLVPIVS